jgi:hypothetical protein
MEVYVDGKVFYLDDYKSLEFFGLRGKSIKSTVSEKGQKEELIAWGNAIQEGTNWPIPLWQQVQTTQISFEIDNLINQ